MNVLKMNDSERTNKEIVGIEDLVNDFSQRPEVESIALGGSRALSINDENSDYDVYVYLSKDLSAEVRKEILQKYCKYMEINNQYWEIEDDCTLHNGIVIEIIYRTIDDLRNSVKNVVEEANASNGYTTCIWNNLLECKILYDCNHKLQQLKEQYTISYPDKLRYNIIKKNLELLDGYIPSYSLQIEKALERRDIVSINHRITEFLASYFDIIFAINKQTHPGEKRLIQLCQNKCEKIPQDFAGNLEKLLTVNIDKEQVMKTVKEIVNNVNELVKKEGLYNKE